MGKISRKFYTIIFATLVAILMSIFMSFVLTAVNIGFPDFFLAAWMKSLGLGFVVALPVSMLVIPLVRKIIHPLFESEH